MAPLAEQLLETGSGALAKGVSRTKRALVASAAFSGACLLGVGLFSAGADFGRTTPHEHAAYGLKLPKNLSSPLSMVELPNCYQYTGGTCHIDECNPDRKAECSSGLCMCAMGCTGADGKCRHRKYEQVASGFTLTNKKYSWSKLYMPAANLMDQLKTSSVPAWTLGGRFRFILHRLPARVNHHHDYFLTTEAYPDYVATIRATTGTAFSLAGLYEVGLHREFAPDRLTTQVCSLGDGYIRIGSGGGAGAGLGNAWAYIHHASQYVYGWNLGSAGDAGAWKADPPISGLEACIE